jgi:hypothetical protein
MTFFNSKKDRLNQTVFFKKYLDQQFYTQKGVFKTNITAILRTLYLYQILSVFIPQFERAWRSIVLI